MTEQARPARRNQAAAVSWDHPSANAFDCFAAAVVTARYLMPWPLGCPVVATMDAETAGCIVFDAPPGRVTPCAAGFGVYVLDPAARKVERLATIVVGDPGKPGRVVIAPEAGGPDVWIQAIAPDTK